MAGKRLAYGLGGLVLLGGFTVAAVCGVFGVDRIVSDAEARVVTVTYDQTTGMVECSYDTVASEDRYVTTVGRGGPGPWGEGFLEQDPSGGVGHAVAEDPPGTVYDFTVIWYDACRNKTAMITRSTTKP